MIKAIAFDYGGVIEIEDGDLIQEIADYFKITKEDWHKAYYSFNYLCNIGNSGWQEVLTLVCIDNAEKSLEKAEEIGFVPLLYINNEKLKEELDNLL